jgi:hypothetical protein
MPCENEKKIVKLFFVKRVILSAGAMLIFSVSFQIDHVSRRTTGSKSWGL